MCNQPPGPAWINTRSGIRRGIQLPIEVVSQRNRCLRANIEGVSDPYKGCRSGTIAGRMACVLVAALLACASSVHGQIVEEGGFPVKGGGVSGESFSLSCPPRLYVEAGESVLLSCSATAVPEEGVRYEWESLSGDGLHLLSNANERSPLFTAPVSEAGGEYVYRLTAMSVGVYETATVTVMARGVSGGSVQGGGKLPVAQEDCDSFGALEGFREGCATEDKMPPSFEPFEDGLEGEGGPGFLFPEAPGLPDRPSGPVRSGGLGPQTPPYLDCPAAVFLEELETGSIECHAWDASGEEFLEYSWEPVGSTTRDYLNNPRLIPEDAPNPSVVAPEAPVYETLESFHSGETTFRYRYRLTATSRATGLSSSSGVGVYVSSSRPSVYCPLEIVVEEGSTATLDCEGVDPLSHRMDYDEDGASIEWEWEGLWGTSTAHLDETDLSSPLFTAPVGSAGEEYHYIASMTSSASGAPRTARRRVTVRVTEAEEGEQAAGDASALAYKGAVPVVTCNDSEVYEATADFTLDCSVTDEPTGATYAWTARGSTANTDDLSSTTILKPTFDVPDNIDADTDYDYTVTLSAAGIDNVTADVTVTVLEKPDISCSQGVWSLYEVYEGTPDALLANGCVPGWRGAPGANPVYTFAWTARGSTTDTHLISATNIETPTFYVPDMVESDEIYEYTLTVSAENADDFTLKVTVTVRGVLAPVITCNNPDPVYEGSADIVLDCSVTYEPSGATYNWGVYELNRLSSTTILKPTFSVPDDVPANFSSYRYRYAVTLSVAGADVSSGYITVTVLNKPDITVTCEDSPYDVDEGDAYFDFDCSASGAPGDDPDYTWSWSPTTNLTNHDTATPTFAVPASVDQHTTYTYTVTASADNAEDGTAEVTVTVKDLVPVITCNDAEAYEDTADFTLDCSVTDEPTGATYAWTARGSTANTNDLSSTTILKPTFDVPDNVDADTDYDYTVTLSAGGADVASADITVTVLEKPDIYCPGTALIGIGLFEGSSDFPLLICPDGWRTVLASSDYVYAWTAQGSTTSTDRLSATNIEVPTFALPDAVDKEETYEYTLTVSAENADDALARVEVTVWDRPDITVTCENSPYEVDEGDTDTELECDASGEPDGSTYTWSWSPTTNLTDHNTATPMFAVPDDVDQDTTYTYTVTASSDNADDGTAEVTVTVRDTDSADPSLTCTDSEVYEGASDITLDCSVTNEPSGATYAWTARGSTSGTGELSSTTILKPTFDVPDDIDETGGADKDYEYTITMSASGIDDVTEDVTVTVLEKPDITCRIESYNGPGSITYYQEGNGTFRLPTCPENDLLPARIPRSNFIYSWTGTSDIDLLSATNVHSPTFSIPENLPSSKEYSYRLQVSAPGGNADPRNRVFQIRISDRPDITVTCEDSPYEVDEGDDDFELECEADGVPGLPDYTWSWSPTDGLTNHNTATPTFDVPDNVDQDTTWTYTVTVTEDDGDDGTATVTVTVRDTDSTDPSLTCTDSEVYEGASDITLDCSVTNEPSGATYAWTARGSTSDTDDLSSNTILAPMFDVPDDIDEPNGADKDYDYTVTLSAGGADVASADITVTVLEKPDIYCPGIRQTRLALFEGISDFPLDICYEGWEGAPGANPVYAYAWTARGSTPDTRRLSATNIETPIFDVPDPVESTETYRYTLTVSAANADDASVPINVLVVDRDSTDPSLTCTDSEVYEGAADITLDCSVTDEPTGATYAWTARGSTSGTSLLSSTTILKPTFDVPDNVDADTDYNYTVTLSASGIDDVTEDVTVRVLNKPSLTLVCAPIAPVYEGAADFDLDCVASGDPSGSDNYTYVWTARGATSNTDLLIAGTDGPTPTFDVPEEVASDETYEYTLTVSADNAEDASANVTVRVLNKPSLTLICTPVAPVYEGAEDFDLDCSASGAPTGSDPVYVWTARGATSNTDNLSSTTVEKPTFDVPEEVDSDETYEYTLTVSADNAESATEEVTVTVLNKKALEVACATPSPVYEESEDFALDCAATGAPAGSEYAYVWTGRGSTTNTDLLVSGTDGPTPTFDVPEQVDEDETYEYLLTVSAENAIDATAEVTVKVLNFGSIALICASPPLVYEGSEDFELDCSILGDTGDTDYTYEWTARGATPNTDELSATNIPSPTFYVPDALDRATTYEYLLTARAANVEDATAEVTVTILNRGTLAVACAPPPLVYEGSEDFALDCAASGAPVGSDYEYVWTARGSTSNTDLLIAGTDGPTPTFNVPDALDETTTYEYLLTASAENAESSSARVTVTVLNRGALSVVCVDPPSVYEGSEDFDLDCSASGAPSGSAYEYAWTARGSTPNTDLLTSGTNGPTPTFAVPDEVAATTTYEYLLTASAENAESGSAEVTVTVLNAGALRVVCADPPSVYEGSADLALDCSASGAPAGSEYAYVWTARGTTANTDELSAVDISSPTFYVPEEVDETTTYEYLLTASAENAEDATAEVTVTVLNRGALSVVCLDPGSVYEGSEDITLDCSASGAPAGLDYAYVWTAQGDTENTLQLSATDISSPTFYVPDEVDETTTYEYLLTASAENMEDGAAEVTVTVLNRSALSVVCADPGSVYEGSEDITLDCTASGAPSGSAYEYAWTARESTANTDELSAVDISSPTFYVPDEVDETTTYEYLLTVSAENAEDGAAEVTVTVLNRGGALSVVCMNPGSVYEGSEDITLDCTASGAPEGSEYAYVWTAQGDTENTLQLSATDIPSPTFYVPDAVDVTTDYEYLLTASAENAEDASAEVVVTVLNRGPLSVVCTDPGSVYEGSEDFAFDCTASGAPPGPEYTYVWTARDSTANTDLLSRVDISSPTFYVPDDVDSTTTYKYLLTASADNAEDASAEVMVTVLDGAPLVLDDAIAGRVYIFTVGEVIEDVLLPEATGGLSPYTYTLEPVLPRGLRLKVDGDTTRTISGTPLEVSPRSEYTWQVTDANAETAQIAFFIEVAPAADTTSVPIAESSSELPELSALGVTVSASSLRFGVQSAETQVSLDPMTDGISTRVSGLYHAGRMTLSPGGSEALDENGEMDLSIELASPVVLRRKGGVEAASIVLAPSWSLAESCEQLSSQAIRGLYTEVTLSESDCRLLRFGGKLDLTDVPSGRYMGSMDIILRSGESEETHTVDVEVTVVPVQRVITIGPGGVRFSTSRELPVGLTEEQNLSIYPHVAFLTEEKPHGVFELSNPSLIPLEISVSARFGYTEATENGREVVVEDSSGSRLNDLSEVVDIHPGVLVLQPGEKGLVWYGVKEEAHAAMAQKGYAAFFDVVSEPRLYVRSDQMPEEISGDRTARVTMRVPGVYVPAEGTSQLRATLLSISFVGSMSATFLLETADHPFAGEVVAYDGDGRELGRRETLVYTRSRVRIPLDRMPEEGAVFLRFAPRGSGRVPEPAFIEWDAPRRDIGAAEDKDRTTTTATLVQKP